MSKLLSFGILKTMSTNYLEGDFSFGKKKYRHIFFDMDQTLTRSRSVVEPDMKRALQDLSSFSDGIVVSGANEEQIFKQITDDLKGKIYILSQNGNSALGKDGKVLWRNVLSDAQKSEIYSHIDHIKREFSNLYKGAVDADQIQDRGCQISFSFLGHNAKLESKEAFDPKGELRQTILKKIPFVSTSLEVKIGGTTCLDYFELGKNKGHNVLALIKNLGWNAEDSLYVGDALFPGGNDESVVGVCDTFQVASLAETLVLIRKII
ncbi:MAG: HAD-IIB family hydrolase [Candidatus Taylorbacteria bacterium]|nr:HAD-IIB family hydrolase [Candidatus Taylorbacteria bacterium]